MVGIFRQAAEEEVGLHQQRPPLDTAIARFVQDQPKFQHYAPGHLPQSEASETDSDEATEVAEGSLYASGGC